MRRRLTISSGFTLIEMLIVVSILAILAIVIYPHFSHTSVLADDNAKRAQLEYIRRQIELYRAQHGSNLPNLINGWDDLTKPSNYHGRTFGPYLNGVPYNHKRGNVYDGIKVDPPGPYAYVYDYRGGTGTGQIWATNGSGERLRKW